jgi:hypothetical protein
MRGCGRLPTRADGELAEHGGDVMVDRLGDSETWS